MLNLAVHVCLSETLIYNDIWSPRGRRLASLQSTAMTVIRSTLADFAMTYYYLLIKPTALYHREYNTCLPYIVYDSKFSELLVKITV